MSGREADCIHYPSREFDSFEGACRHAVNLGRPLRLTGHVKIKESVRLWGRENLEIFGPDEIDASSSSETGGCKINVIPPTSISGDVHSLFMLSNKSRLTITSVQLEHTLETEDHKLIGAAVNLRNKAQATLVNCYVRSSAGFCAWVVERSRVEARRCTLLAPIRSAVVGLGMSPRIILDECEILDAGVHGVCVRATRPLGKDCYHVELRRCKFDGNTVRAIYGYFHAKMIIDDCTIKNTWRSDHAAVQMAQNGQAIPDDQAPKKHSKKKTSVESKKDLSPLKMVNCKVFDNAGFGVRLQGFDEESVSTIMENNEVYDNAIGNVIVAPLDLSASADEGTGAGQPLLYQRDESGSSFRLGDWWCLSDSKHSEPIIVKATLEKCHDCGAEKDEHGRVLTSEEISRCNRQLPMNWEEDDSVGSATPIWCFDSGDEKAGGRDRWVPYDKESQSILESCFQKREIASGGPDKAGPDGDKADEDIAEEPGVVLSEGKYFVDMSAMIQTNVETQFPRLVRRTLIRN